MGKPPFQKAFLIGQFLTHRGELAVHRVDLGIDAFGLGGGLFGAALQLFKLAVMRVQPRREEFQLPVDLFGHFGVRLCAGGEVRRDRDGGGVIPLCLQPGAAGLHFDQLALHDGIFGFQRAAIEAQQKIPRRDALAFGDMERFDHAAIRVLHDLPVLFDLYLAGGDDGALDMRQRPPAAKAEEEQDDHAIAQPERAARRPIGVRGTRGHRTPPCAAAPVISAWFLTISRST